MRRIAIVATIALVVLVAGWTALWSFAAHEASSQLDAWIATEATQGRIWTCPNRTTGGFPIALSISCRDATFSGDALGQNVKASVASLDGGASLLDPHRITVKLQPPFAYRSADGTVDLHGTWSSLEVDLGGLPEIATAALSGTDVQVEGLFGPAGRDETRSSRLAALVGMPTSGADPTMDFDVSVDGTDIPQIDALVGDTHVADLHVVGRLHRADAAEGRTPEEAMEHWRQAGGHIDLAPSDISRAGAKVSATGALALDAAHRPQGRLQAEFVGLGPILKRYGINANLAAAGAFLSTLLGGPPRSAPPPQPGTISLPISLQDGRLGIGPIRTDIKLLPLY